MMHDEGPEVSFAERVLGILVCVLEAEDRTQENKSSQFA